MKIKSELVNDDWERIYINGNLMFASHRVTARNLMEVFREFGLAEVEFIEVEEEE